MIDAQQQRFTTTTIEIIESVPEEQSDVNQDGTLTAIDALMVVNFLNRNNAFEGGITNLDNTRSLYDVIGDGSVSALDALIVINRLNEQQLALNDANRTAQPEPLGELNIQPGPLVSFVTSLQSDREDDWAELQTHIQYLLKYRGE